MIAAFGLGGYIVHRLLASRSPLNDANKIFAIAPWHISTDSLYSGRDYLYAWQDNETILYALQDQQHKYHLMRQRVRGGNPSAAQPLPNIPPLTDLEDFSASPDGKWLLTNCLGQSYHHEQTVFALDTGAVKQKYTRDNDLATWMNDSRSYVSQMFSSQNFEQFWVEKHAMTRLRNPLNGWGFEWLSSAGECFAERGTISGGTGQQLERGSIFTGKSQTQTLKSHGSERETILLDVSPQGDRLLWKQQWEERSWFADLWGKLMHHSGNANAYEEWYVTDANGNNPQTLVKLSLGNDTSNHQTGFIAVPAWLPDGKHLSIVYHGALYVVDVP